MVYMPSSAGQALHFPKLILLLWWYKSGYQPLPALHTRQYKIIYFRTTNSAWHLTETTTALSEVMILPQCSTIYLLVTRTGGHLGSAFENPTPQWNLQPEAHFSVDESVRGCEENLQTLQLLALKNNLVPYGTLLGNHFLLFLPVEVEAELTVRDCLEGSFPQHWLYPFVLFQHSQMI
jgi:hypothetical protein